MKGFARRLVTRLLHGGFLLVRPMTLGVRVAAFSRDGRVCLVRHTYLPGWYLPGGGVEPGETVEEAARRELREETGVAFDGPLALHGILFNRRASRRDHVVLLVARDVEVGSLRRGGREIAEAGAFSPDALPEATTAATRARLAEIVEGRPSAAVW